MTEDAKILQHMEEHGSITPAEAYEVAGCIACQSAIARLRHAGHAITTVMQSGNGKRWGEYFLAVPYG